VFHQKQQKKKAAVTKPMSSIGIIRSPRLQNYDEKVYSTDEALCKSKDTIDLPKEDTPTPKPVVKDDTWKQEMGEKMDRLLASIADITSKLSKVVVDAPLPSAVSVQSAAGNSSVTSVLKEVVA
jgi:hypothetical protein